MVGIGWDWLGLLGIDLDGFGLADMDVDGLALPGLGLAGTHWDQLRTEMVWDWLG